MTGGKSRFATPKEGFQLNRMNPASIRKVQAIPIQSHRRATMMDRSGISSVPALLVEVS
jgi:hypothetical protein